jgi:hypothetical protein
MSTPPVKIDPPVHVDPAQVEAQLIAEASAPPLERDRPVRPSSPLPILYVGVPGTNSDTKGWDSSDSSLATYLRTHGLDNIAGSARSRYHWSTNLNLGRKHRDWVAAGWALYYYYVPQLYPELSIPPHRANVICHSHGLQAVLYACSFGLKLNALVSVGSPVRKDMETTTRLARPNIARWLHIHSDFSDHWQWLGTLFDGRFGIVRRHSFADINDEVPSVGHGGVLCDPNHFHFWQEKGWIDFVKGRGPLAQDKSVGPVGPPDDPSLATRNEPELIKP